MIKRYGFWGGIHLVLNVVRTRIFFSNSRLIRFPIYIRGRQSINFGSGLTTGVNVRIDAENYKTGKVVIEFGDNVQLNDSVHIAAIEKIHIGDNALIASRVFISDHNHGLYHTPDIDSTPDVPPARRPIHSSPVYIGRNVWIGEQVCILPGVKIGDGAIVGANSVVTRDVPANTIIAGNPARIIRVFDATTKAWIKT